jgi:UDP-N-acetyl-alpha-D-muramoyl-L-alanyl-L-glutamate epimerase
MIIIFDVILQKHILTKRIPARMQTPNRQTDYNILRREFPEFHYENYRIFRQGDDLHFEFHFRAGDKYHFRPGYTIPLSGLSVSKDVQDVIEGLVFNIGMTEAVSYWKAFCSPRFVVHRSLPDEDAVQWWKKLYYLGLGEFFYTNGIHTTIRDFMQIESGGFPAPTAVSLSTKEGCLVPVGGGKDSAVTMGLLNRSDIEFTPFAVNPRKAVRDTINAAGIPAGKTVVFRRKLDPLLLELNSRGFLNGHTPFSALLAFTSATAAALTGLKHVVLSNEASADEPTVAGTEVNHQYSKSLEFETDFRLYLHQYIGTDVNYFSLLRPLREIDIAAIFAGFEEYHTVFRSCNAGSKTDSWCCKCPKCLFTYIILSPFLSSEKLSEFFGNNIMDDISLKPCLDELTGISETKPFECIGTIDEVNLALQLTLKKTPEPLPALLKAYAMGPAFIRYSHLTDAYIPVNPETSSHFLPEKFLDIIKRSLQ